jgi:hypothetical protein
MNEPILCYVDECWAYFTTAPLDEQWGDDWNDAPYEHNAGTPYEREPYKISKVAFDFEFYGMERPCDSHLNSPYSVEQINAGAIAWLRTPSYFEKQVIISAGTTLSDFKRLIKEAGGKVYIEDEN